MLLRNGFSAIGGVVFRGATIGGQFSCDDGSFSDDKGPALDCDAATIGASVFLRNGFVSKGEVNFVRATIKGNFRCSRASFEAADPFDAIDLEAAQIGGTLYLTKIKAFKGNLDLQDTYAKNVADDGSIRNDDRNRVFGILKKTLNWVLNRRQKKPTTIYLDRFCYDSFADDFEGPRTDLSSGARLAWLEMQPEGWCGKEFRPQPFTRCAKVLRSMGYTKDARLILFERERRRLKHKDVKWWERWFRASTLGFFSGYGYKAHRAFAALIVVWLIGGGLYTIEGEYGLMRVRSDNVLASDWYVMRNTRPPDYEPFKPWLYSLDVLLPIIDFQQKQAWVPDDGRDRVPGFERILPPTPDTEWTNLLRGFLAWLPKGYYWFEIAMGWFLTTVIIAGFTGLLGNPREE